jgi:hypothetical protein
MMRKITLFVRVDKKLFYICKILQLLHMHVVVAQWYSVRLEICGTLDRIPRVCLPFLTDDRGSRKIKFVEIYVIYS